jgi:hypothetical protein
MNGEVLIALFASTAAVEELPAMLARGSRRD